MGIAAPAAGQPLLLTLLVALGGSIIGGLATLCGGWLTAKWNRQKDKLEREARWEHEEKQRRLADRQQLLIDVAEAVEARKSWLHMVDYGLEHDATAPLAALKFQLSARIKLFGSPELNYAWDQFIERLHYVEMEMALGNVHQNVELNRPDLDDQNACPDGRVHGDVVLALLRLLVLQSDNKFDLRRFLLEVEYGVGDPKDARYQEMRSKWLEKASLENSFWKMLDQSSSKKLQKA